MNRQYKCEICNNVTGVPALRVAPGAIAWLTIYCEKHPDKEMMRVYDEPEGK